MRNLLEGDSLGMTQRALTEVMSSDANTIASLLERMESSGLVERQHHEKDRRAYRIRVTSEGKKKHSEIRKIAVQLQTEILKVLPESQRDRFLESLESVSEACRNVANKNNGEQK
jgi:DNA-binding MarR family transcriptional regulator